MNQYHIYEAIGRGKHSTVYKGRKKKSIEYYAIKSVDKSQKNKVLQEVRILHSLDHSNVLKFYSWYETSAHLWLVLEYCVGGDLMTLLRQDSRLPEDSIHDLARDLVRALQFLHSKGIIYCDLKPSNILLDENGRMKLCDFGLSRRLSDISKSSISTLPQAKRGTPCYMAPELFQDGGVHSYASDFWALGCVLYECYAGRPPFVGNEFTQLVQSILSDPTPPLPDNPTGTFASLINCLLTKDPAERVQWPELCQHGFWRMKFTSVPLPPQPAFSNMLQLSAKPCLSERNGDKPPQDRTPPKYREKGSNRILKQDENSLTVAGGLETPVRTTPSGRKIQTKAFGRVAEKQKEAAKGVNLLRLSRIARSNLQRENEHENYRRPLQRENEHKRSENDTDVKIVNNDMELDFSENTEEDTPDESDGSDNLPHTPGERLLTQNIDSDGKEELDNNTIQSNIPPDGNAAMPDDLKAAEQNSCSEHIEVAATPPGVGLQRRGQRIRAGSGSARDADLCKSSNNLSLVLWHSSDLSVRPVMPSRKGDKTLESLPSLPFDAFAACDFVKLSSDHLDALNSRIIIILNGNSPVSEKQNTIRYLEMLSGNADAANILTNGPVMLVLVKMLRQSKASILRLQLVSVIGLLIRHSTFIETDLASSGIIGALTDGLRDKQEKVRRFCMAALGELLFYISTQNEHSRDSSIPESPSKDNRSAPGWQVPGSLIALVSSILRKGEDDVTQLYALRTIENICSQGGDWAARFTSQDVIGNLCYIYKAVGKQESTRLTAGSCLVRLARFSPPTIQSVMEKLSFKDCTTSLVKGSPREQQISLNLLNMAMLGSHLFTNMGQHLLPLVEEKQLIPSLVSLIEQGTEVLRGKVLVFVALLCKNSRRWLPYFFCNVRLLSAVDRLAKEKDSFLQQCVEAFVQVVAATVPGLLEAVSVDIQQMMGGKRHGQIASLAGRGNPKNNAHLFPVVLNLLGSSSFKNKVVTNQVLQQLANLVKLLESPFQGRDDLQLTLLRILESITEEPSFILEDPNIFIGHVLPSLAILYKGNKDGDARFLCLKILFDVMVVFLENLPNSSPGDNERERELKALSNIHFLPLYPIFIEDEDPIPMYAQKLLVMFIEYKYVKVSDILHLQMVSKCFEFLLGDLSSANVNNVKLCMALASAPEMETKTLSHLRVVRKIGNLLEFVNAKDMEDFLEPTLGLCKAFVVHAIGSKRANSYPKEPALVGVTFFDMDVSVDPQNYIKDISDFGSNVGIFLELSGNHKTQIADLASDCLILLLKAAPREASMGLLTNLSKFCIALECLRRGVSNLLLLRLLHALGYSCRQYLPQAMILSISMPDIKRIEGIVSALRTSSIREVADAASEVFSELQRLPRCL